MKYAVKISVAALLMIGASGAVMAQDTPGTQVELRSSGNEGVPDLDSPVFYERPAAASGAADNLGNHNATQDLNMQWSRVINLNNPTEDYHAATKWYVDQNAGGGGGAADNLGNHRATRELNMAWNRIKDLNTPTDDYHAANKWYVDQAVAGVSGGGGDNMGDHGARMDISMHGYTLWNLGHLNMEGNDIRNSNIKNSTLHQPIIYGAQIEGSGIKWSTINDTWANRLDVDDSIIVNSKVDYSVINHPEINFMKAYFSTQFFGFNEHFNDVWMHGNQIKEAKIAHSLDLQQSPLINLRDPVNNRDAVNLRYLRAENQKLKTEIDSLKARVTAIENN